MRLRLDYILLAVIIPLFTVHFMALVSGWYISHSWMDIPMHMGGGLFVGMLFFYVFFERWRVLSRDMKLLPAAVLALGFTALVGVSWEFYEYIVYGGAAPPGIYLDTLLDLLNDLIGGGIGVLIWKFFITPNALSS